MAFSLCPTDERLQTRSLIRYIIYESPEVSLQEDLIISLNTMKYFWRSKDRNHFKNYVWALVIRGYLAYTEFKHFSVLLILNIKDNQIIVET